jgi:hypothetical protein
MNPPFSPVPVEAEHRAYFNLDLADDDWDD